MQQREDQRRDREDREDQQRRRKDRKDQPGFEWRERWRERWSARERYAVEHYNSRYAAGIGAMDMANDVIHASRNTAAVKARLRREGTTP